MKHKLVNRARIPKTDLRFGRMDVDINQFRIDRQKQHKRRLPPVVQHVGVGLANRVLQQFVAHKTTVDEGKLLIAPGARITRQGNKPAQGESRMGFVHRHRRAGEFIPQNRHHTFRRCLWRI